MSQLYLDFNASTPIAPEVRDAMTPYLREHFGNPSASHWAAEPARRGVEQARVQVAAVLGARPDEIVFTSGGTESNNQALKGVIFRRRLAGQGPGQVITSAVEHPSVLETCEFLERFGTEVTRLPVDGSGRVNPDDLRRAIRSDTLLVSIMHANNEVGTLQPIPELSAIAREHQALFHTDAAQSIGKVPVDVERLGVDLLTVAGHKCYAPKGVGALYIRRGVELEPLLHGGGHELGRRSGTESAALAVALGTACELVKSCDMERLRELRDRLFERIRESFGDGVTQNGDLVERLPNTLNVSFIGLDASVRLPRLQERGMALSTGSACHAGDREMSPVLRAMGVAPDVGFGALRLSLGRTTTREEIDEAAAILTDVFRG